MSELPAPNVLGWQALYQPNARARCIRDNPPMYGFGRQIKSGEIVNVHDVCWRNGYELAVAEEECAFYKLEGYFEIVEISGGMAYSDDERVEIIDHDHREDSCSED